MVWAEGREKGKAEAQGEWRWRK